MRISSEALTAELLQSWRITAVMSPSLWSLTMTEEREESESRNTEIGTLPVLRKSARS